ncbi:MAG: Maf family nucleotide pyrophosphatase [Bacteroidales bacterium]|nr:Maf family nucleotide pyrophosphatase [Bacteroidales bacterium]
MKFYEEIAKYRIILGSQSPRRQYLLKELGIKFDVKLKRMFQEDYPEGLTGEEIPLYLAGKKADAFDDELTENMIVITADTVVLKDQKVLQKPKDQKEAFDMLRTLSGTVHQVYTGVCIRSIKKRETFHSRTDVHFKELSDKEIWYYIDKYEPFDKAGSYGIQEWLGYIGVERIEGSFFNVMGLPVQKLYVEMRKFLNK